jgi:hypothetical protein
MSAPPPTQPDDVVTLLPVARTVPEQDGGWLVLTPKSHAWLHGDRLSANRDKKWLDDQWRRQP